MRHYLLCALVALGFCCTMPELDGYQLECNWNDVINGDANSDDLCPKGQICRAGCCVTGNEEPTCQLLDGFGSEASSAGVSCTGGCSDLSCKGTCPIESAASCLDETSSGFPGGMCTWPCSNCDGVCAPLPGFPNGLCAAHCENDSHCRKGYRCNCSLPTNFGNPNARCGCVPDCRGMPDVCGAGRKVDGSRCDSSTGLCYACLKDGQTCADATDCCGGACCLGVCQDGECGT